MEEEVWKDIKGYEGLYKLSNYGRVKNKKGKIVQAYDSKKKGKETPYKRINLYKNGKKKQYVVARLVAKHFLDIGDINNYNITYKDGNSTNLYYKNLKIMSENSIENRCEKLHNIEYDGKCFKNIKELSDYYKLPPSIFYTRLQRGWTLEEAIKVPIGAASNNTLWYKYYEKFYTMNQLSKISGIKKRTLRARIKYRNWSIEQAVDVPKMQ